MSLQVEINYAYFPEQFPPPKEDSSKWSNELKQRIFHQQAQIHMINIGPVTQDILDSKLFDADFGGVKFTWNKETKEYLWMSNESDASKPLPMKYTRHLIGELRKVGYQMQNEWYRPSRETPTHEMHLVNKEIWHLEKKY